MSCLDLDRSILKIIQATTSKNRVNGVSIRNAVEIGMIMFITLSALQFLAIFLHFLGNIMEHCLIATLFSNIVCSTFFSQNLMHCNVHILNWAIKLQNRTTWTIILLIICLTRSWLNSVLMRIVFATHYGIMTLMTLSILVNIIL